MPVNTEMFGKLIDYYKAIDVVPDWSYNHCASAALAMIDPSPEDTLYESMPYTTIERFQAAFGLNYDQAAHIMNGRNLRTNIHTLKISGARVVEWLIERMNDALEYERETNAGSSGRSSEGSGASSGGGTPEGN